MKKLQELFSNDGKFFQKMNELNIRPSGDWFTSINLATADRYFYLSARRKNVFLDIYPEDGTLEEAFRNIVAILSTYDYKLDGLYNSMFLEYDPLVNYDRTEVQTHNEKVSTDDHVTTNDLGARSQTNRDKTTSFDSSEDYNKATDEGNISSAAAIDVTTQAAYEDNSNGGYNLIVKGNIGVTTSQQMLESEREVREFNFYNEVLRIFYDTILYSGWEV